MEYFIYHLAKIFSAVIGGILVYTVVMKFGKGVQYFFLGKTYTQFDMLDSIVEIPPESILIFINVTNKEEIVYKSSVRDECFNTTCLCLIKFEDIYLMPISNPLGPGDINFETKYIRDNSPYVISVKLSDLEWQVWNLSYPMIFATVYEDFAPRDNILYELINLNSDIFCRKISKKFYLQSSSSLLPLVAIVNPSSNKPLKLFVSYEKLGDNKYLFIVNQIFEEPES